ncbi:MAG: hypothetical protein B6247_14795 [Candidatus Parabeggiatoa sp. nov. 2]|nr:MAG: hypothetical protein B6247_14795 [Beggiatoa sp. 4572_84]
MSVEREKITVHSLESRPAFQEGFSSVEVFKRMVKAFTGVNLQIKEVETEKEFHKPVGNVKVKFDLFAEDEKNRTIVEAQHANYSQNFERFYYYHLIAITETIKSSQDYHFPKTVYTLVFTKAPDADTGMPEERREWIQAIHETLKGWVYLHKFRTPEIKMLFERLKTENTSPELHTKMMDERMERQRENERLKAYGRKIARDLWRHDATISSLVLSSATGLPLAELEALREKMTEKGEI